MQRSMPVSSFRYSRCQSGLTVLCLDIGSVVLRREFKTWIARYGSASLHRIGALLCCGLSSAHWDWGTNAPLWAESSLLARRKLHVQGDTLARPGDSRL